jgi:hypothetical protein
VSAFPRRRFGKLDRGRATMGAKHCWVTDSLALLDTKPAERADFFRSRREAKRWIALKQEERFGGVIRNLRRQVKFKLHATRPDGVKVHVCSYVADFVYERKVNSAANHHLIQFAEGAPEQWWEVIEDSKGHKTDIYTLKKKWLEAEYFPKTIVEV